MCKTTDDNISCCYGKHTNVKNGVSWVIKVARTDINIVVAWLTESMIQLTLNLLSCRTFLMATSSLVSHNLA